MVRIYPLQEEKTARIVPLVSGLLFWIFGVTYLGVFQGNMLALLVENRMHWSVSEIQWIISLSVTLLLFLLGVLLRRYMKGRSIDMAYLPSYVILGLITFNTQGWHPTMLLIASVYLVLSLFLLWGRGSLNATLLRVIAFCFFTVSIGNTNDILHYEKAMEMAVRKGNYEKVLSIAGKALPSSRQMTVMRMQALLRIDKIGEQLFEYPLYYEPELLLNAVETDSVAGKDTLDIRLTSLLLKKDLDTFYKELTEADSLHRALPKHYAEAFTLYKSLYPELSRTSDSIDKELNAKFEDFMKIKKLEISPIAAENQARRKYGDTYWWYYFYQEAMGED